MPSRIPKAPKPKVDPVARLRARYRKYDPDVEGYGDPSQWQAAWDNVMNADDARRVLGEDNPLTVLGFTEMPTQSDLIKRYREMMLLNHPDKGGSTAQCQTIIAAYSELKRRLTNV